MMLVVRVSFVFVKDFLMRLLVYGVVLASSALIAAASRAEDYALDDTHAGVNFKISHLGLSWTYGRFNDLAVAFSIDPTNPANPAFALNIKSDSLDTNNKQRDDHLRGPDFFNTKQFPQIAFKSTAVKAIDGGYEVTGDFSLRGVTKSIAFPLKGGRTAEFPKGVFRTVFVTELGIKRSEFGLEKMVGPIGDEVFISISFEGVKK